MKNNIPFITVLLLSFCFAFSQGKTENLTAAQRMIKNELQARYGKDIVVTFRTDSTKYPRTLRFKGVEINCGNPPVKGKLVEFTECFLEENKHIFDLSEENTFRITEKRENEVGLLVSLTQYVRGIQVPSSITFQFSHGGKLLGVSSNVYDPQTIPVIQPVVDENTAVEIANREKIDYFRKKHTLNRMNVSFNSKFPITLTELRYEFVYNDALEEREIKLMWYVRFGKYNSMYIDAVSGEPIWNFGFPRPEMNGVIHQFGKPVVNTPQKNENRQQ